jgi:hypothetical protein
MLEQTTLRLNRPFWHFLRSEQANFTLAQATLRLDGHLGREHLYG